MAYTLTHADSKTEIEVRSDEVAMYRSQGWETKPTAKAPAADEKKK